MKTNVTSVISIRIDPFATLSMSKRAVQQERASVCVCVCVCVCVGCGMREQACAGCAT